MNNMILLTDEGRATDARLYLHTKKLEMILYAHILLFFDPTEIKPNVSKNLHQQKQANKQTKQIKFTECSGKSFLFSKAI